MTLCIVAMPVSNVAGHSGAESPDMKDIRSGPTIMAHCVVLARLHKHLVVSLPVEGGVGVLRDEGEVGAPLLEDVEEVDQRALRGHDDRLRERRPASHRVVCLQWSMGQSTRPLLGFGSWMLCSRTL
jgi:hypothetical protein